MIEKPYQELRDMGLRRLTLAGTTCVTSELLEQFAEEPQARFSEHVRFMYDEMALQISQKVWGREVERQYHEYPSDWWQAFKDRWFPKWAKRRWPVRLTIVAMTARELYPKVRASDMGPVIAIDKNVYQATREECENGSTETA